MSQGDKCPRERVMIGRLDTTKNWTYSGVGEMPL